VNAGIVANPTAINLIRTPSQIAEFVHEKTHARSRRADHFR
jgi:hypothetical protein